MRYDIILNTKTIVLLLNNNRYTSLIYYTNLWYHYDENYTLHHFLLNKYIKLVINFPVYSKYFVYKLLDKSINLLKY